MTRLPLKRQSVVPRIDGITKDLIRLRQLAELPQEEFCDTSRDHFDIAKARLREALEGVFNIGGHILGRLEGARATEYKEIARKLGEYGIVDRQFADTTLVRMAGYRNRLTHFYAEISPEEMHGILETDLPDFGTYLEAIKSVLENPERFGLTIEE